MGPWYAGGPKKVASLLARSNSCVLFQVQGQNLSGSDRYLMIFDANALPDNGSEPLYGYLVPDRNLCAVQLPSVGPGDVGRKLKIGAFVAWSTSPETLTLATNSGPIYANGLDT